MNFSEKFNDRIDKGRFDDGLMAADFLAKNFKATGRYNVDESWGPEGILYLAESSWALMDAYRVTDKRSYIDAVISILKELQRLQKKSGGWSIDLGKSGVCFKVTEEERNDSMLYEDPPTTAAFLRTISEYQELTGDDSYFPMGEKAFNYLLEMWDASEGTFIDKQKRKLLGLRSNPNAYHLFFLIGLSAWRNFRPGAIDDIYPVMLEFVKGTFEKFDTNTMPLICALHATVLMDHCDDDYIQTMIRQSIDVNLVNNDTFRVPTVPGGFGHRDGSRGIVTTEAHMRSSVGIAIAMKKFDLVTGTNTYRNSFQYNEIAGWIDQMKAEQFYYEFETLPERIKNGYGSPGQYLPCWWILGRV
jgi:hypothetical protein